MKILTALLAPALAFALFACASTHESQSLPKGQQIGEEVHPQTPVRFAIVDASPKQYFDKTVLVEATVKAVCQHQGCWMQVEDEGRTAMVRWETGCGGKYAFPKDLAGKRVLIQGTFYPKHTDADQVAHYETEAGKKLGIPAEGYEFNASSVIILES